MSVEDNSAVSVPEKPTNGPDTVHVNPVYNKPVSAATEIQPDVEMVKINNLGRPTAECNAATKLRHSTLFARVLFKGYNKYARMLIDTGAAVSLLPLHFYKRLSPDEKGMEPSDLNIKAGNDTDINCCGKVELEFMFLHYLKTFRHEFYICADDTMPIIGMDFMGRYDTLIDLANNVFMIDDVYLDVDISCDFA